MAFSPGSSPSTGTPRKRASRPPWWALVATRLHPPRVHAPTVERERLCRALDESHEVSLFLVHAPAGFGKTTLLVQWYHLACARGRSVAWVGLDDIDQDPDRFLALIAEALRIAMPMMENRIDQLFMHAAEMPRSLRVAQLMAEVEQQDHDVTLVIDDLRSTSQASLEILNSIVDGAGRRLHVVIACREIPPLSLARLRMRKAFAEIDARDLQFRRDEAVKFLLGAVETGLTSEQAEALWSKTDGWIAGMQLAALSLRRGRDASAFLAEFSGHHRDIGDLLAEEVLANLDVPTLEFLLRTSPLTVLSADLCNDMTGRTDGQEVLQRLERDGLFLLPLDDTRTYYRFHAMFAEFLQRTLESREPGAAVGLHRAAAHWHMRHGFAVRATEHALRAADHALAARILDSHAAEMTSTGRGGTLVALASRLDPLIARAYPRLQLQRAYALTLAWHFSDAEALLRDLRVQLADTGAVARWEVLGLDQESVYREIIRCEAQLALLTDAMPTATRLSEEWLALPGEKSRFDLAVARTSVIYGRREMYDCAGVELAPEIRQQFVDTQNRWATVWHDTIIGSTLVHTGDLPSAEALYRGALATAIEVSGADSSTTAMPALYLSELLYEKNQREEASDLSERYLALAGETGLIDQLVAGYVTRARLQFIQERDDPRAALETISRGLNLAGAKRFERLRAHLIAEQVRLLLLSGESRQAYRVARAADLVGDGERFKPVRGVTTIVELQAITWCRVALSQDRVADAINVLEKWIKFAELRQARRSLIRCGVLLSLAHLRRGDTRRAVRQLRACLVVGRQGEFVRSFVDAGEPIRELLSAGHDVESHDNAVVGQYRRHLLEHFPGARRPPTSSSFPQMVSIAEALGPRELEVLTLVARGQMNSQIGDELGLTVGTVKWYMQQIFAKLGARRRSEAIHRARQLGLIS